MFRKIMIPCLCFSLMSHVSFAEITVNGTDVSVKGPLNILPGGSIVFHDGVLSNAAGITGPKGDKGDTGPAGSVPVPLNISYTMDSAGAISGTNAGGLGWGVYGYATAGTGENSGVLGISDSVVGAGVTGYASTSIGKNSGVIGESNSSSGIGVNGHATALTGLNRGVAGDTQSTSGTGVSGYASATTGSNIGVSGGTASSQGHAGVFAGDVSVFGDFNATGAKAFIQPHPENPSKEIVYIAIEAPEAMIMYRGVARLESGKATIELPDYFRMVAHEQWIGVQVTPRSLSSKGLAAYEVSRQQVKIGELMEGTGSYEFDYIITGRRAGFETHEPIQANKHFTADGLSQADFEKRHSGDNSKNKAVRNILIKNGTLNPDGKLNTETTKRQQWTLDESGTGKR
jgi:hypothetical protein